MKELRTNGYGFVLSAILCLIVMSGHYCNVLAEGNKEGTVVIGINVPLSGSYSDQGKDEEKAYNLAIEQINAKGGVLGKKIIPVVKDTQTKADVARKNALELIKKNKAVMVTGGASSAVAIAQSDVCQEHGVLFMAALTHSNATTGHKKTMGGFTVQKAHRHLFRWYNNAWMTVRALGPFLVKNMKKEADYYFITADYTWGHSLEESVRWVTEAAGSETVGAVLTPLGQKDFKAELLAVQKAKPDVLVLVLFGRDMVNALKQADAMGLKGKMKIVVPLMELNMAHGAGLEVMEGVLATKNWYWGLKDQYPGSKKFVDAFKAKYKKAPGSAAAAAWIAVHQWVDAAERTGSFSSEKIIKALEDHKFTCLKGIEKWRSWDHQAVSSVYIVEGKSPAESKNEWDLLKIIGEVKGEEVMRSRAENPITLEPLSSERRRRTP